MERGPFLSTEVQKEFGRLVEITLYTDGPSENRKNRDFQKERFATVALPYYAVLDPTGQKVLWQDGGFIEPKQLAESLRAAQE